MKKTQVFLTLLLPATVLLQNPAVAGQSADQRMLERGRYLVVVGGCNDCHTPGYGESGGPRDTRQPSARVRVGRLPASRVATLIET